MNIYRAIYIVILTLSTVLASAQITLTPALPTDGDSVKVLFNAALGNAGLQGYTGDVYAHTGVITNLSSGNSDWRYVKANWGVNIPACKLTSLGGDMYELKIGPSIRQYYNVPANENILRMAFVFRSGVQVSGAWLEGKTASGGDIFGDVYPSGLNVSILSPNNDFVIANLGSGTPISVASAFADSTFLYLGNQLLASTISGTLNYNLVASTYGGNYVKAIAKNDTAMVADSFYYYVSPSVIVEPLPAGMKYGINYLSDTSVTLVLFAPLKQNVFAIGDFTNWLPTDEGYMKRSPDGKTYWKEIHGLVAGTPYIYQYLVDGAIRIGDPYADKISDPYDDSYISSSTYPGMIPYPYGKTQGRATVLETGQTPYVWQSGAFTPAKNTDLVVYELLIRDFTESHTYQGVIDKLWYLKELGYNAIELMPFCEFEGNVGWGYFPNFTFATDKYYGHPNDLKRLVDTCHQLGIAVLQDLVLNHAAGSSPYAMLYWDNANNRPAANSPFFNAIAKHDYNVGCDFNHSSPESKKYLTDNIKYWMTEFRVDGYRFDLSKGFTQNNTLGNMSAWAAYDPQRIGFLKSYYDTLKAINPNVVLILEHYSDNPEEKELSNYGMLIWGAGFGQFRYASIGVNSNGLSDFSWISYKNRGWTNPHVVGYMESHDEERQMYYSLTAGISGGTYNIKDTVTALQRMKLNAAFFFTVPGPKMSYEFGERGYDYSKYWPCGNEACKMDPKPPRWDYLNDFYRKDLVFYYSSLIKLKITEPVFESSDFVMNVSATLKQIRLRNTDQAVVVLGNFGVIQADIIANFYHTGTWYDYFSGDSLQVPSLNYIVSLGPGEFKIYTAKKLNTPIGFQENVLAENQVIVYPNPVNDLCHIAIQTVIPQQCKIEAFDALGRHVQTIFNSKADAGDDIQWSPKGKGLFVLKIHVGDQCFFRKVVVR